ncbi:uncharacterized protein LOC142598484 isoform X2 [Balearica regulorum gibbericeps]|uniref:uncharacterized protein LOC142598484 isoform X2 n=1 Tax=Balearica regulorum gibbericeps TaxID=100784 RepID=UPI003F614BF5
MESRGVGTGWLCIAVLCSGAALVVKEGEPGHQSITQRDDVLEPTGAPTTTAGDVDNLMTCPTATPTPPQTGDPFTTPVLTRAGNKTQNASAVPVRYWAPVIFVVVALFVLFFTYRRNKGEDLGALDHLPIHDTTPIISAPQVSPADGDPLTVGCEDLELLSSPCVALGKPQPVPQFPHPLLPHYAVEVGDEVGQRSSLAGGEEGVRETPSPRAHRNHLLRAGPPTTPA